MWPKPYLEMFCLNADIDKMKNVCKIKVFMIWRYWSYLRVETPHTKFVRTLMSKEGKKYELVLIDVNEIWPIETQDPKSSSCPVIWTKTFPHPLPRRNTPAVKFLINDSQIQKKLVKLWI